MPTRSKIFVSYSHKDGRLFEEFKVMMAPAIQRGIVDLWDDRKIPPGAKWNEEIEKALASAGIAVLLVSQNFLASHFIAENELPPLLNAVREEGVTIFWIYLSSCLFGETEIASYQAAHDISRPLDRLSKSQRQAVLSSVCAKVIRAAECAEPLLAPTKAAPQATTADTDSTLRVVIDRIQPLVKWKRGRVVTYGTVSLLDGSVGYGEGVSIQVTVENPCGSSVMVRSICLRVIEYDPHPIETSSYPELTTSGTHLEMPSSVRAQAIELSQVHTLERDIPIIPGRLLLGPKGTIESCHTLAFEVVAGLSGLWKLRVAASALDVDGKRSPVEATSPTICIVRN